METKRVAIGELEWEALDWAVAAVAEKYFEIHGGEVGFNYVRVPGNAPFHKSEPYSPSTVWSQCGPLIERYEVSVEHACGDWGASLWRGSDMVVVEADSPLIAACRAIVASHNPDGYVEVPVELISEKHDDN